MAKKLKVTYIKSTIGGTQRQKDTIRSLGFRRLHEERIINDNPALRGMCNRVIHLVKVEEVSE